MTVYKQVAVAQGTTLIPRRAEAVFGELVRFEPLPATATKTATSS